MEETTEEDPSPRMDRLAATEFTETYRHLSGSSSGGHDNLQQDQVTHWGF